MFVHLCKSVMIGAWMSYDIKVGGTCRVKKTQGLNCTYGYKSRAFMYLIPNLTSNLLLCS